MDSNNDKNDKNTNHDKDSNSDRNDKGSNND